MIFFNVDELFFTSQSDGAAHKVYDNLNWGLPKIKGVFDKNYENKGRSPPSEVSLLQSIPISILFKSIKVKSFSKATTSTAKLLAYVQESGDGNSIKTNSLI